MDEDREQTEAEGENETVFTVITVVKSWNESPTIINVFIFSSVLR